MNATTRYDKWALRTMNDQRTKRYHATQTARRRIVAAHAVTTALGLAAVLFSYATSTTWPLAVLLVALALWIPLTGLLNSATDGLLELRTRALDERQLAERGTVHTLAHRITGWAMIAAILAFVLTPLTGTPLADQGTPLAATAVTLFAAQRLLPLWLAALRVRDVPDGDE